MVRLSDEQILRAKYPKGTDVSGLLVFPHDIAIAEAQLRAVVEDLRLRECNCTRTGLWAQEQAVQEIRLEYEAELEEDNGGKV